MTEQKYDKENPFAKIIRKEIPTDIVYEDDVCLAFNDISPAAPIHVLVVPKGEYISFHDFAQKAGEQEVSAFFRSVRKIADDLGLDDNGYRVIFNHGADASQTVFHFHVHIIGGRALGGLVPSDNKIR